MDKDQAQQTIDELLTYKLMTLADTLRQVATQGYGSHFGISVPELRILATVQGREPITANEISRVTRIDKGWVSRSVRDLMERDLLERHADPADRRVWHLSLTRRGKTLVQGMWPFAAERNDWLTTDVDRAALEEMIGSIQRRTERMLDGDGPQGDKVAAEPPARRTARHEET